jgi:ABC-type Zn uptake system ZnuABC Zn-binding protein ZnuA
MMKASAWLFLLLVVGALIASAEQTRGVHLLRVVATTTQLTDLARNVVGKAARVDGILSANVDPHDYEPVPSDLTKIATADLILENGVGLETWMARLVQSKRPGVPVVVASRGVRLRPGSKEEPQGDPHVWFAVPNAALMVRNIRDALAAADPGHAAIFRQNAAGYLPQLDALDTYIFQRIGTIPRSQRKFVTSHDAFQYYVNRYGLTLVGAVIPSGTTEAKPSAQHLADLVHQIRSQHVKAIFTESSINPKLAQQIAREAGVRVYSTLYADTLGPAGSPGETYVTMMRYDTDLIVAALR